MVGCYGGSVRVVDIADVVDGGVAAGVAGVGDTVVVAVGYADGVAVLGGYGVGCAV